ncbi:MAG: glyoxylate/hydroxypyruvate reductase [Aliidongia sp.]|nr:glyoxylate/hydroxypyruvate reductase [Aliidongia sp.]
MIVAFTSSYDSFHLWEPALRRAMPEIDLRPALEIGDPAEIDAAIVWRPPPGWLAGLPNLKLILSQGAGVDHILNDPLRPPHVPIVRLVDPYMTSLMVEYVTFQVLRLHLREPEFRRQQGRCEWREAGPPLARDRRVGILGLGELGAAVAAALATLGFEVAGWSRTPKDLPGIASFSGTEALDAFLARTEILVCLMPLTAATRGILGRTTFDRLPRGAGVINAGRGGHLVEADLLEALASGQIADAVLDVFETEPLPHDHAFWHHPQIVVTPHVAARTNPTTAAQAMAANLRRLASGEAFPDRVDPETGY